MNIYSKPGTKVKVCSVNGKVQGGYESDKELIIKYLDLKKTYTVEYIEIHDSCSYVYLKEVPDIGFNTVCFNTVVKKKKNTEKDLKFYEIGF